MIIAEQVSSAYHSIDQYFNAIRAFEQVVDQVRLSESQNTEQITGVFDFIFDQSADEMKQACVTAVELSKPFELILKAETPIEQRFCSGIWQDETLYFSVVDCLDAWGIRMYQWGSRVLDRKRKHPYAWSAGAFESPLTDEVVKPLLLRWYHEEQMLLEAVSKGITIRKTKTAENDKDDKDDTKNDTEKKPVKKSRRSMNSKTIDCARRFKHENPLNLPMRTIIEDYVAEHGGSVEGIMRVLNDNPDQWKDDIK